jgi:ABC-type Fe3+ transport system permease subunit
VIVPATLRGRLEGVDRSLPVWIGAALVLFVLMALPLGWLGYMSVSGSGGTTVAHYRDAFLDPALRKALWNTLVLALWTGLASIAVGAPPRPDTTKSTS